MSVTRSNVQKAQDGSLIYKRRSAQLSLPSTSGSEPDKGMLSSLRKRGSTDQSPASAKRRRTLITSSSGEVKENDAFCWICHKEGELTCCELCPRVYHLKCLAIEAPGDDWVCPECEAMMKAECLDTRSKAMAMISLDTLCTLLKYAVNRMKHSESEAFCRPVDTNDVKNYKDFVIRPMDLSTLEKNIRRREYGSTEAFLADAKWILHNCVVFNGDHHKLTVHAKTIIKICKHEMSEIEICPECYLNSCTQTNSNWFCEPCTSPHPLVWAKMKGYPFWPAKVLRESNGQIDVRFFGEHDRAWVPANQVFLLSKESPAPAKHNRAGFEKSMKELQKYISKLRDHGISFSYAPFKTPYDSKQHSSTGTIKRTRKSLTPSSPGRGRQSTGESPGLKRTPGSPEKAKTPSAASKTASAVKLKYNSIISTRRAAAAKIAGMAAKEGNQEGKETGGAEEKEEVVAKGEEKLVEESPSASSSEVKKDEESLKEVMGDKEFEKKSVDSKGVFVISDPALDQEHGSAQLSISTSPDKITIETPKSKLKDLVQKIGEKIRSVGVCECSDGEEGDLEISEGPKEGESTDGVEGVLKGACSEETETQVERRELPPPDEKAEEDAEAMSDTIDVEGIDCETSVTDSQHYKENLEKLVETCKEKLGLDKEAENSNLDGDKNGDVIDDDETAEESSNTENVTETSDDEEDEEGSEPETAPKAPKKHQRVDIRKLKAMQKNQDGSTSRDENSSSSPSVSKASKSRGSTTQHPWWKQLKSSHKVPMKADYLWRRRQLRKMAAKYSREVRLRKYLDGLKPKPSSSEVLANHTSSEGKSKDTEKGASETEAANAEVGRKSPAVVPIEVDPKVPSTEPLEFDLEGFNYSAYTDTVMAALKGTFTKFCKDVLNSDNAVKKHVQLELDRIRWLHQQELAEVKHNANVAQLEMKRVMEKEKDDALAKLKAEMLEQKEKAVNETKKKQWCASCGKEAIFYCCWNTSYCDYPCQEAHWPKHMSTCTQNQSQDPSSEDSSEKSRGPPQSARDPSTDPVIISESRGSPLSVAKAKTITTTASENWQDKIRAMNRQMEGQNSSPFTSSPSAPRPYVPPHQSLGQAQILHGGPQPPLPSNLMPNLQVQYIQPPGGVQGHVPNAFHQQQSFLNPSSLQGASLVPGVPQGVPPVMYSLVRRSIAPQVTPVVRATSAAQGAPMMGVPRPSVRMVRPGAMPYSPHPQF